MKKNAKWLCLLLAVTMIVGVAAGCGSDSGNGGKSTSNVKITEKGASEGKGSAAAKVTIDETVLVDQDDIVITAKSLDKGDSGPELKLLIENNTDTNVNVETDYVAVNGYIIGDWLFADVAAGKKSNETLLLTQSDLDWAGITTIADIELKFTVSDADTYDDLFTFDPVQLETSAADGYEYTYDNTGDLIFSEDGIEVVVKGLEDGDEWTGPGILVYLYNGTDRDIYVESDQESVNGFMIDPFFYEKLPAGKHVVTLMEFNRKDLKENDIDTIEDVEVTFQFIEVGTYDTIGQSDLISLHFD